MKHYPQHLWTGVIASAVWLSASTGAQAFELGEAQILTNDDRFSAQITIHDLKNDGYSRMTGEVKSYSPFSDELEYRIQTTSDGEGIALLLTHPSRLSEALTLEVSLMYRGEKVQRQYTLNPGLPVLDTDGDETRAVVTTITTEPGVIREAETLRVQQFDLALTHATHTVEPGQSLYEIALDCRELGGSDYQRAIAIYAANKSAFADGDINQIPVGSLLNIPKRSYIDLFTPEEARSMFFRVVTGELELLVDNPDKPLAVPDTPPTSEITEIGSEDSEKSLLSHYPNLRQWMMLLRQERESRENLSRRVNNNQATTNAEIQRLQSQITQLETTNADLTEKLNRVEQTQVQLKQRSDELSAWVRTEKEIEKDPKIVIPINQ